MHSIQWPKQTETRFSHAAGRGYVTGASSDVQRMMQTKVYQKISRNVPSVVKQRPRILSKH